MLKFEIGSNIIFELHAASDQIVYNLTEIPINIEIHVFVDKLIIYL